MKNSGKGWQDIIRFSLDTQHRLELVDATTMKRIPSLKKILEKIAIAFG